MEDVSNGHPMMITMPTSQGKRDLTGKIFTLYSRDDVNRCIHDTQEKETRRFLRAVYEGNKDEVVQLMGDGVPIDCTHQSGLQAIHFAAKSGDVEMSRELLRKGASVNAVTQKGSTPLHIASLLGKTDVVKLLLKSGADVNRLSTYNDENFSALYMAAQIGHQEIVTLLLAYGADPAIQTKNGSTAKYVATQQGFKVVAQILEEYEVRSKSNYRLAASTSSSSSLGAESKASSDMHDEEEDMQISVEKLKLSDHDTETANGFSHENKENVSSGGKRYGAEGAVGGAKYHHYNKSDRKFNSGKDIILNKLKANLPPIYGEAFPSPVHSPRRVPRSKSRDKNLPK